MSRFLLGVSLIALGCPTAFAQGDDNSALAEKARSVFKTYCHRCHNGPGSEGGDFDVLNPRTLTSPREEGKPLIVPGKPTESLLVRRIEKGLKKERGSMPPKNIPVRPGEADVAVIRHWVEAGAPAAVAKQPRPFLNTKSVLTAIRDDLRKAEPEDRRYLRYFTLTHLHNNPRVPDGDLPVYRAALAKAMNSLSWKPTIVLPRAIDKEETIFAVDIRDLDWDRHRLWQAVAARYPYGLSYGDVPELRDLDLEVQKETDTKLSYVRADWFAATSTRPPLYHTLLKLPTCAGDLEKRLEVNIPANFQRNRLARAGFGKSGVSGQNRLVERHSALYGAYWKSYDFKEGNALGNLPQYPLGPLFSGNRFTDQAFQQDGGEIIFNLPNGLQAYMLVNGKDERIDQGPVEVVSDALKTGGTPSIVNGLSCMACHKHGMISFRDTIRAGHAVAGDAALKVLKLYPPLEPDMARLLKSDEDRFMVALEQTIGPFLRKGANKQAALRDLPEPVGEIARLYRLVDLGPGEAAAELGIEKPADLLAMLKGNPRLRELGLGPLLTGGGVIKRKDWEGDKAGPLFQRAALEMEIGTPVKVTAD